VLFSSKYNLFALLRRKAPFTHFFSLLFIFFLQFTFLSLHFFSPLLSCYPSLLFLLFSCFTRPFITCLRWLDLKPLSLTHFSVLFSSIYNLFAFLGRKTPFTQLPPCAVTFSRWGIDYTSITRIAMLAGDFILLIGPPKSDRLKARVQTK